MGLFFDHEVWTGGFYELALEYTAGADSALAEGARCVWGLRLMEGCYLDNGRDPDDQPKVAFDQTLLARHLYGVATLSTGVRVACGTCAVSETQGSEWLILYLPMSALGRAHPVGGFPFDRGDHEGWRRPVDEWLVKIGRSVFEVAPFRLGLVGFEVSGDVQADEIVSSGVPEKRNGGILLPKQGELEWHPRTETGG